MQSNKSPNRQIKAGGSYNLNFIDWNNEWERVSEVETIIDNGGMIEDKEEYDRVYNNMNKEKEKNGVNKNNFIKIKPDLEKDCYICLKTFIAKSVVIQLPCKHAFDDHCITPWIKINHTCPICKYNLKNENDTESN